MASYNHSWPGGSPDIIVIAFAPIILNLVDILKA